MMLGQMSLGEQGFPDEVRQLTDALDMGLVLVDADLVIRAWNRWMEDASGRPAAQVLGQPLHVAYPEIAGGSIESAFRRATAGEAVVLSHRLHRYLLPFPVDSGLGFEMMQQTARIHPVMRAGEPAGAVAMIQDVTERVAREEELRDALQRAQAGSDAKSAFLATTSHELRTPLTAVVGYTELIENEVAGPTTPRQREFLGRIKFSTWHLLSLIDEILTFSRLEAGKEEVAVERFDLCELARETILLVEPQALQKELELTCAAPDRMPIRSDRRKVRQILLNLLGNAVKFTESGSIRLELLQTDEQIVCHVHDTGIGIESANVERIFEAFAQAEQPTTRSKGGTGLGLAVSRGLAELIGGTLNVTSTPGAGSTFTLVLPRDATPVERA